MPGYRGRWPGARRDRRTSDDDLLSALLIRVRALESGRSLPRNVRPGQLSEEELIGFWADDLSPVAGHPQARIAFSGQVCAMLKFDIAGFTRPDRDEEARIYIRKAFYGMLREALEESGMPWERCHREDRGDGALVIAPPGITAHGIIDPFPGQLRHRIQVYNRMTIPPGQIKVRAAAHIGLVYRDDHGLAGDSLNLLSRMLDAEPLHTALASSGAELALIISDYIHDNLVLRHPARAARTPFRPVNTEVKGTQISAWIHVPGAARLQRTRPRRPARRALSRSGGHRPGRSPPSAAPRRPSPRPAWRASSRCSADEPRLRRSVQGAFALKAASSALPACCILSQ
jgi:hypothetical protein